MISTSTLNQIGQNEEQNENQNMIRNMGNYCPSANDILLSEYNENNSNLLTVTYFMIIITDFEYSCFYLRLILTGRYRNC